MEYGQVLDFRKLEQIDFSLPSLEDARELRQLERLRRAARTQVQPRVYVGAPIWGESKWVGTYYPPQTRSSDFLREYAKQFSTVEINSTFYAVPAPQTFEQWRAAVPATFRFCPKLPKLVSHQLANPDRQAWSAFLSGVEILGEQVGLCFLQLPHYFDPKDPRSERALLRFLDEASSKLKLAVEVRHSNFFQDRMWSSEWVEHFAARRVSAVMVDTPGERTLSYGSLTSRKLMVRFLGANLHPTDFTRLEAWAERAAAWIQNGLEELYFLIHEPDNSLSPQAVEHWIACINKVFLDQKIALNLEPPTRYSLF